MIESEVDLVPIDRERIGQVLREHLPGLRVAIYGSRVKGRARETSDVDLVCGARIRIRSGRRVRRSRRAACRCWSIFTDGKSCLRSFGPKSRRRRWCCRMRDPTMRHPGPPEASES